MTYLERFTKAYVEAALWSSLTDDDEGFDDAGFSWDDIDNESRQRIEADCERFTRENAADLLDIDAAQAGHDFWLTRNGHGAGFWDRDLGEVGERLTEAAHGFQQRFGDVNVMAYQAGNRELLEIR